MSCSQEDHFHASIETEFRVIRTQALTFGPDLFVTLHASTGPDLQELELGLPVVDNEVLKAPAFGALLVVPLLRRQELESHAAFASPACLQEEIAPA
ncbi:hypothetical protein P8C59_006223 [Phyllachora maydis]|uniref:Uncharacterized protein n=1 Tax=Phyllachora maydis TaxID=1825666 RepID=A0AAD9I741_9PEZI|nr:hypothetical protein P8C59_006223 [Phyllachora maydis]